MEIENKLYCLFGLELIQRVGMCESFQKYLIVIVRRDRKQKNKLLFAASNFMKFLASCN